MWVPYYHNLCWCELNTGKELRSFFECVFSSSHFNIAFAFAFAEMELKTTFAYMFSWPVCSRCGCIWCITFNLCMHWKKSHPQVSEWVDTWQTVLIYRHRLTSIQSDRMYLCVFRSFFLVIARSFELCAIGSICLTRSNFIKIPEFHSDF